MIKNIGLIDKILRIIVALLLVAMFFMKVVAGALAFVLIAVSVVFLVTSFVGFCPLYYPFKISTNKVEMNK